MIRRPFHALATLAAFAGTVAAALYRDRAAHAEEREDAAHDLVSEAIADKQQAWTELGLMRDRAERAERDLAKEREISDHFAATALTRQVKILDAQDTADACYEIGWRAIVARNGWQSAWEALRGHADTAGYELAAARARIAELEQASERAKRIAAEVTDYIRDLQSDTGRARCAGCRKLRDCGWSADGLPRCDDCHPGQASAPVEPAAVDAVATPKCTMCDAVTALTVGGSNIPCCYSCQSDHGVERVRARYAARAAQTVAAAVEPADDDVVAHVKAQMGDMDPNEFARRMNAIDPLARCKSHGKRACHCEDTAPAQSTFEVSFDVGEVNAALNAMRDTPTQDDLDDAAVRELLARGPATWWAIGDVLDKSAVGKIGPRVEGVFQRIGIVHSSIGFGWSLPTTTAPEASK